MSWVLLVAVLAVLVGAMLVARRYGFGPRAAAEPLSGAASTDQTKIASVAPSPLDEPPPSLRAPSPLSLYETHFGDEHEPTATHPLFSMLSAACTHVGRKRPSNEDSLLCRGDLDLFAVADGMGGEVAGELASRLALETLERELTASKSAKRLMLDVPPRAEHLVRAILSADAKLHARTEQEPELRGMGTTLVALRFVPNKNLIYGVHVGDSRAYRLRDGELTQLTHDQTLGRIIGAQGGMGSRLAWALGSGEARPEAFSVTPEFDDVYLLCSDGLTKMVGDQRISEILANVRGLAECAQALIDEANANGGHDNVSVIVIRVVPVAQ